MTTSRHSVPPPTLSRPGDAAPAAPIRIVHLGLGNFFRAHQAWYTDLASDAEAWGIAAFAGRSAELAETLAAQDGLFTLITRAADGDTARVIGSISRAHAASNIERWLDYLIRPEVGIVTLTVTEAGYGRGSDGDLDTNRDDVQSDLAMLRTAGTGLRTIPGRLVAGLAARRRAGVGGLAVVSCDNLPGNGAVTATVTGQFAALIDRDLAGWIDDNVSFVNTMVDRITPASAAEDLASSAELTGRFDRGPVVTEPFSEWVLAGDFPAGRPRWDDVGARFVDDVGPFEERKLWLLNGGHSLLAYAGSARGHHTIAQAMGDAVCRDWLEQWWNEASEYLTLPADDVVAYRQALLTRFDNSRIRHLLAQIAADGSVKLPIRILPTVRRERGVGRLPTGGLRVLAAWINHLRGAGAPVKDAAAEQLRPIAAGPIEHAAAAILDYLDPALAADEPLVAAVIELTSAVGA